jgi:hypothetical protein
MSNTLNLCKSCSVELWADDIRDGIQLCHACYPETDAFADVTPQRAAATLKNFQSQADLIHQTFGIPVTVYGFDGQAPIKSRGTAGHRSLSNIAWDIIDDWKKPYFGAVPYLDAMQTLDQITDRFYEDDASDIVVYFLANASTWRGPVAKTIKAELKAILKEVN